MCEDMAYILWIICKNENLGKQWLKMSKTSHPHSSTSFLPTQSLPKFPCTYPFLILTVQNVWDLGKSSFSFLLFPHPRPYFPSHPPTPRSDPRKCWPNILLGKDKLRQGKPSISIIIKSLNLLRKWWLLFRSASIKQSNHELVKLISSC